MVKVDLLIIGGGTAGEYAGRAAARSGVSVALVEKTRIGGACVFNACIPTKSLLQAVRAFKKARDASFFGLPALEKNPDYLHVKEFKDKIVQGRGTGRDERLTGLGVRIFKGTGRFISPNEVTGGEEHIHAGKIIITTGSSPAVPPIPGLREAGYLTHTGALELERVPEKLAIIGAGPVGLEFAQIFAAFGSQVHLYELADHILSNDDIEISLALANLLSEQGISISTSTKVSEIQRTSSGKVIVAEKPDGEKWSEEFSEILVATGHRPVTEELNLAVAGIQTRSGGIKVDLSLQTNIPHIWAAGDVTGTFNYVSIAGEQGRTASMNAATGIRRELNYYILPRATFCDPEAASVGLTEKQARESGYQIKVGKFDYADLARSIISGETEGFIKIVADEKSGRILGGHILGSEASTLIQEVAAAIAGKLTVSDLSDLLHVYPSFNEGIRYASQRLARQLDSERLIADSTDIK
ncbi:MAG: NAD(P)/FAD-dependent oxidoreductase [Dehalococcoidales bacterium]|nr:NAD(P)/FAD-dependent oxidoreductase [Dehalococcoidales bacterium]